MRLCFAASTPLILNASRAAVSVHVLRRPGHATSRARSVVRALSAAVQPPRAAPSPVTEENVLLKPGASRSPPSFQDAVRLLQDYWARTGCIVWQPCNTEVGAGTMNPATFLRVLGPEPWSVAYEEPSLRPDDSRYGENPNRLQRHTQFQVIVKPAPANAQELVLGSYKALGIDVQAHDVRFVEDNWQSPALGAWGLGWEVWLDGMEVTQFTYFQQAGGMPLESVAVEVTYGLERIVMALQRKTHFRDIDFAPGITYGEIFLQSEYEMSKYNLDEADVARNARLFDEYEAEALAMLDKRLPVAAYSYLLKASHTFNVLDARGAVGVTERARFFQRMRKLARDVASLWVERRGELNFPLLSAGAGDSVKTADTAAVQRTTTSSVPLSEKETFLMEIGVEELPPDDLTSMISQVETLSIDLLNDSELSYDSINVSGTPRRVAVTVSNLQTKQHDKKMRVRGPPLRIALDDKKMPTKAALGFLKKNGVSDANNPAVEYNEEEGYLYATVERRGKGAVDLLSERLASDVLSKISFIKTMRWNDSGVAFSRPVRWLACMVGAQVVPVDFAGVTSGSRSMSLRGGDGFPSPILLADAGSYADAIRAQQIVLSVDQRKNEIARQAAELARQVGGEWKCEEDLLDEVANLVENPIPIVGRFDASFLGLPDPVLTSVMKKHQRYFPVVNAESGALINAFIAVVNGDKSKVDLEAIREGNEAVLRARYSDASFFYGNDTKGGKALADFVPQLDRLAFQESLGSMLDKRNRICNATPHYCELLGLDEKERVVADHVAKLAKADLATSMVIEMTSLAGIMGKHYAEKSGEVDAEVCDAIFDASLPRFSGDKLPASRPGAVVAVADRLDSLVALFSIGLAPKSTADPFALRRAALGVVQILIEQRFDVNLRALVQETGSELTSLSAGAGGDDNVSAVVRFIEKRLEGFLLDASIRPDVVKAVMAVEGNSANPFVAMEKANALQTMLVEEAEMMEDATEICGRTVRMMRAGGYSNVEELASAAVDESLFEGDEESSLLNAISKEEQALRDPECALNDRLRRLAGLKSSVDTFFDNCLVLADDERVRQNRMALCAKLAMFTCTQVDLSLLQL